jgi:hypothetical protein
MMFALMCDVVSYSLQMAHTDRERTVSTLPFEELTGVPMLSEQVRGRTFEMLHQVGYRKCRGQSHQKMYMILDPSQCEYIRAEFITLGF